MRGARSTGGAGEDRRLLGPSAAVAAVARGAVARYSANGDRRRDRPQQRPSVELSSDLSSAVTEFSSLNNSNGEGSPSNRSPGTPRARRRRCVYCSQKYNPDDNRKGSCEEAPDETKRVLECVTCYPLAESLTYHCLRDTEGDYEDPCTCTNSQGVKSLVRWSGLLLLSVVLPCLCFYPCLLGLYGIGRKCGLCGSCHQPRPEKRRRSSSNNAKVSSASNDSNATTTTSSSMPD